MKEDIISDVNKKLCLNCGKEILSEWGNKFCSRSCSASFNNRHRDDSVYKKISNTLKEKSLHSKSYKDETIKQTQANTKKCIFCGKEYAARIYSKYCSSNCAIEHKHQIAYEYFLKNSEKYCRGNYTPKAFKKDFLKEQNGVCAICGNKPEHNGKPLVFVLDHIDGDASNNKRDNLRMICPNCDSQLDTFKSKNKNSKRRKYWKEKIIQNLTENVSN